MTNLLLKVYVSVFWENKNNYDICSELTGIKSDFWKSETSYNECEDLLIRKAQFWLYTIFLLYTSFIIKSAVDRLLYWGFNKVLRFAKSYFRQVGRQPIDGEQNIIPLLQSGKLDSPLLVHVPLNTLYFAPSGHLKSNGF